MYLDWNKQKVSHLQEQLSTGLRLVRASDGTNDLFIANEHKQLITSLNKGISNLKQGLAAVREAEEAAGKIYDLLVKVKETLVEIADVSSDRERQNALETIKGYLAQIQALVDSTIYENNNNGLGVVNDYKNSAILGQGAHHIHYGPNKNEDLIIENAGITVIATSASAQLKINTKISLKWNTYNASNPVLSQLGGNAKYTVYLLSTGLSTDTYTFTLMTESFKTSNIESYIEETDKALKAVGKLLTFLGQTEELLQNLVENQQYKTQQMQEIESNLRDVDYAKAFAEMNKMNVVLQANVAALAQNNQINQLVTQLMR
jgi:flagellin-like hook-associated protein FlgL